MDMLMIILDIHIISMDKDIHIIITAIHMTMEKMTMVMTIAMELVILEEEYRIKFWRKSRSITNLLLKTMTCHFQPSLELPLHTITRTMNQVCMLPNHLQRTMYLSSTNTTTYFEQL